MWQTRKKCVTSTECTIQQCAQKEYPILQRGPKSPKFFFITKVQICAKQDVLFTSYKNWELTTIDKLGDNGAWGCHPGPPVPGQLLQKIILHFTTSKKRKTKTARTHCPTNHSAVES